MLILGMSALGIAVMLVLNAFQDNIVFFLSPSELAQKHVPDGRRIRLGGLVKKGSIDRAKDGVTIRFVVTDLAKEVTVVFKGILPDLFREGQGVVAEGKLRNGTFYASEVLAKHDETYMPPDVAAKLKKSGEWRANAEHSLAKQP